MKFCSNCGAELLPNANFCPSCGNKIIRTESQSSSRSSATNNEKSTESKSTDNKSFTNFKESINTKENRTSNVENSSSITSAGNIAFSPSQKKVIVTSLVVFILVIIVIIRFTNNQDTSGTTSSGNITMGMENAGANSNSEIEAANKAAQLAAITERNISIRNNWDDYILVGRSGFKYSDLGGISDLSIIVTNKTEYVIDRIYVAVDIITVNGYKHKTEYLFFQNLKPYSRQEQMVPPTTRGKTVEYRITNIYSNSLNFKWDEGDNTGNGSLNDPWKSNE